MLYYFAVAVSYAEEGNMGLVLEELQKRYELAATGHDTLSMAETLRMIGYILLEENKKEEARQKYDQAHQLYTDSNMPEELRQRYKEVMLYDQARIALKENNLEEAQRLVEEYAQKVSTQDNASRDRVVRGLRGMLAFSDQQYDRVIELFKETGEEDPSMMFLLGSAYELNGEREKAREEYKKILALNMLNSLEYALYRHKAEKNLLNLETAAVAQ
jgi:Flp pilus assembly protein TadD